MKRILVVDDESSIRKFAKQQKFATLTCSCPHGDLSRRKKVANIINDLRKSCPEITTNIFKSTQRIKTEYLGVSKENIQG